MKFAELNPTVLTGTIAVLVDDYQGAEDLNGLTVHKYGCIKVDKGTKEQKSKATVYSTIAPDVLEVDNDGFLLEDVNRLSRRNEKTGKQGWIVRPGTQFNMDGIGF